MTNAALVPPYYDPTYGWVNNSQWLQAASGGPHSYDPNPLGAPYLYNGGTTSPSGTSIALNATAHNYALDNSYCGAFNSGAPPFFTSQYYQDPSDCEPVNGNVTGRATGTLWAYWNWTGSGGAPDHLNILLTTLVQASKSFEGQAEQQGTATQAGTLTATSTASDGDPYNETATSEGAGQVVVGHHLLRVPVSNGVATVSLNGNVKASATNTVPFGGFGYPYFQTYGGNYLTGALSYASVSATANIDSRDLTLYRDGAKPGFIGNDGLQHGDWTDSSGTTHGETTFSYYTDAPPHDGSNIAYNTQVLHPQFVGNWTLPVTTWAWDGYNNVIAWNSHTYQVETGDVYYVNGDAQGTAGNPTSETMTYTATDADGATAAATYLLSIHNQWENKRLDPNYPFDVIESDQKVQYNGTDYPAQENRSTTEKIPIQPLTFNSTATAGLTFQLNGSFKISDFFTLGGNFQPNMSLAVQAGQTVSGGEIDPLHFVQLYFHIHYHRNHWLIDHYTSAGFDQTYTQIIDGDEKYISLHWGHEEDLRDAGGP